MTTVLPPRPLRVGFGFTLRQWAVTVFATLVGIAVIGGTGYVQFGNIHQIRADEALWSRGVSAKSGGVHGQEDSDHLIFHSYTLTADYTDTSGKEHVEDISFDTWFQSVHKDGSSFDIRYDPKNPDHCVVSWAIDVSTGRWINAIGWLLLAILIGLVVIRFGLVAMRKLKAARRAGKRSDEVRLRVANVVAGNRRDGLLGDLTGGLLGGGKKRRTYHFETADGKPVGKVTFKLPRKPLFADAGETWAVALACPDDPGKPVVLSDHFSPFSLHRQEAEEARQRLAAERATPQG